MFAFPVWERDTSTYGQVSLVSEKTSLHLDLSPLSIGDSVSKDRPASWSDEQITRVRPLFDLLFGTDPLASAKFDLTRERALLWMYSRVSHAYHLSSQNDGRSWRELRNLHTSGLVSDDAIQRAKKHLRSTSTKQTELLEIAKLTLDQALEGAVDKQALRLRQREVDTLIRYQKARTEQMLLSIAEHEAFL